MTDFDTTDLALVGLYNFLAACIPLVLLLVLLQFIGILFGWRSQYRNRRVKRLAFLIGTAALLPFVLMGLWRGVMRPSLASKANARIAVARENLNVETSVVRVGDLAPTFSAFDSKGNSFNLNDWRGKIVVLNFFATWCGPCLTELPHLNEMCRKYDGNEQIDFVVVGREETAETVREFHAVHEYLFHMLPDPDRVIYSQYAKEIIPRTYLIDRQGKVVVATFGFDIPELERVGMEAERLLAEEGESK